MKLDSYLKLLSKVNSKWNKDWNRRPDSVKLLQENIEKNFLDIGLGNDFLDMTPKAQTTKAKIIKWDYIKLKSFWVAKERFNRDFPGGPVVKNPPSTAGDAGSISGQGTKIPHATGQLSLHTPQLLSLCASTREPSCLNYRAHMLWTPHTTTKEPTHPGAHTPQLERENPHSTTREKPMCHNEEPMHRNEKDTTCLSEDPACCN